MKISHLANPVMNKNRLMNKFRDMSLLPGQRQGYNSTDVHIWAVNMHVQFELFADGLDVLEAFLEVGTCAAHPDLNFVLDESWGKLAKGTNDTLEGGRDLAIHLAQGVFSGSFDCFGVRTSYICEIGNTTTNEQNFAFRAGWSAEHEI